LTFAWSPDSSWLLVGGTGTQTNGLVRISVRSRKARALVVPRRFVEYEVVGWSPDGSLVAFTRESGQPGTNSCCRVELFVARPNGRNARRLFSSADPIHDFPQASWSPDSRSIAFVTDGRDPHDPRFAIIDVPSGAVRSLGGVNPYYQAPAWSPDSKRLAAASPSGYLETLSASGGDVRSLGITANGVTWSKTGVLTIVRGARSNEVLESADGLQSAQIRFRLPRQLSIMRIDRSP
jgi:Tol biopolymer transport system component